MYEVKNRSGWDINIDGVTIPSYNTALFNSFSNRLYVNSLLNKQEISISCVYNEESKNSSTEEISSPKVVENIPNTKDTDSTKTSATRRRKSKDSEEGFIQSNSEKGEINHATD